MRNTELRRRMAAGLGVAPLPIDGYDQEVERAVYLVHTWGLTYTAVAAVMAEYHGVFASPEAWAYRCRQAGVAPAPHGTGRGTGNPRLSRSA